ncbi:MAG TPA: hypothetical protein VMD30_11805, partial [Tepidisphaeraceae bacterium]|nr:hypothetical protein [Tepidisphaeraceae bacterium]
MSDTARSNAPLSEISHLFLTGVRERQTHGNRPVRTPPRPAAPPAENPVKKNVSIDLTPEELEHQSSPGLLCDSDAATQKPSRQISIVLAHHLGERGPSHVRQYARHIALRAGRVGLIELGEQSTRLVCFDASPLAADGAGAAAVIETSDPRKLAEAIEEMSWDIHRWLIFPADGPRTAHGRGLLAAA